MKSVSLLSLAALLVPVTRGHTLFTTLYINNVKQGQGDGTCVRQSTDLQHSNSPVVNVLSNDMACGVGGTVPVKYTCAAPGGAKLTFEFRSSPNKAGKGFIDKSHKGPVAVYAKHLSSADADATGPGWFKMWGEGYDMEADKWATEKMIDTNGLLSITIPSSFPAGNYLFRPEVVAMHNTTPEVEPQFYIGCAQIFLESSVTASLDVPAEKSVSIPGYLHNSDPAMTYNIYRDEEYAHPKKPYPLMGPEPFVPAAVTSAKSVTGSNGKVVHQTEGGVPDSCLLVNGNWCGVEVASYANNLTGCWAAVKDCWSQADSCWAQQPPSGGRNCKVWGDKCKDLDAHCSAKDFTGPPAYELKSDDFPPPGPIPDAVNAKDLGDNNTDGNGDGDGGGSDNDSTTTTRLVIISSVPVTVTVVPTNPASQSPPNPTSLQSIPDFTPRPTGTATATAQPSKTSKPHCGGRRRRRTRSSS